MGIELEQLQVNNLLARPLFTIWVWSRDKVSPIQQYLFDLDGILLGKLAALLERVVEHGLPHNKERYKKFTGYENLHEFKVHPLRVFFFLDGNKIIITTAYLKKKDTTNRDVIARAERIRKEYYSQKGNQN